MRNLREKIILAVGILALPFGYSYASGMLKAAEEETKRSEIIEHARVIASFVAQDEASFGGAFKGEVKKCFSALSAIEVPNAVVDYYVSAMKVATSLASREDFRPMTSDEWDVLFDTQLAREKDRAVKSTVTLEENQRESVMQALASVTANMKPISDCIYKDVAGDA